MTAVPAALVLGKFGEGHLSDKPIICRDVWRDDSIGSVRHGPPPSPWDRRYVARSDGSKEGCELASSIARSELDCPRVRLKDIIDA
jgi:hypothetical protein